MKNQGVLIEHHLDNQLFEIVDLYENRKKQEKEGDKDNISEVGNYTRGTLKECIQGIGMMIPDDQEKEDVKKDKDLNVFFKESEKHKSAKNSPGNVRSVFNIRFLIYRPLRI
jgi:hypothetical protein